MTGPALLGVFGSLFFPGVGHGLAGRRVGAVAWGVAGLVTTLLIMTSVWFLPVTLALRAASSVDAYRCLRRHVPPYRFPIAGIALAIGVVAIAGAQVSIEAFKIPSASMYPTLIIGDQVYVNKLSVKWRTPGRGEIVVFDQPCSHRVFIKRVIAVAGDTVEVRCSVVYVNGAALPSTLIDKDTSYRDLDEAHGEWLVRRVTRYREVLDGHAYETFHSPDDDHRGDFPQRDRFPPGCTHGDFYPDSGARAKQPMGTIVETKDATAPSCDAQLHFVVPAGSLFVMGDNRNNANDSRYWGVVPLDAVLGRAIGVWMSDGPEGGWSRFGDIK